MIFEINNTSITDKTINEKLFSAIDFDSINYNNEYDIEVEYYNNDLIEDKLNDDISYEINKKHYVFIKNVRDFFDDNNIRINRIYLIGTIVNMKDGEMVIGIKKSKYQNFKKNIIWPCKEIMIYDDTKSALDKMYELNQISYEEYENNLNTLQDELGIYEIEDEHYIN